MGLSLSGHHPIRSKGGYSNRRGLSTRFTFECPRSPRLAPWLSYVYQLMTLLAVQSLFKRGLGANVYGRW
jgi:hypothetical protein